MKQAIDNLPKIIDDLIKNTRILLNKLITEKTSSDSPSKRLLLLQHLSVLLTALEKADIPQSCIPDLLGLVMPITEYLTSQGYGNTAGRYHDWTIRLIKLRAGELTTLLSDHLAAKGHLGKLNFEDKLDESKRNHQQSLGTPSNMISSLRDFLDAWRITQENKNPDENKIQARAADISQLEMEFLYQISLNLLTAHQCRYAPDSTIEPSGPKWTALQTAIMNVVQRLKQAKDNSLAWHFLYTLQQSAPRESEWQQQLLNLLLDASQQILGDIQFDIEQMGDWQRYRATLFQHRQDLAVELADTKKLGKDPQSRLAAAEIYSQKIHTLVKTMMEECTRLLGPPPGQLSFCFLTLGSFSRREVLPYSDFEAVCLVGDEKHTTWNSNDSRGENRYLAAWYDYFQFKMISLGESAGLRLDEDGITKGHPGEPELRKTPTQLIAMLRLGSHTADKLYYSLLNAQYLYGIDGNALFDTYQRELNNLFTASQSLTIEEKYEKTSATTIMQQIACRHLQSCDNYFQHKLEMKKSSEKSPIHLKQDYWEPLIYLLHHLALYYGKTPGPTHEAITFLAENKLITSAVALDWRTAIADLYQLRWRQHHQRCSQHEFWEEKTSDAPIIELQQLHSIKNRLLIPGYRMLSHWLSRHEWPTDPFAAYLNENLPVWLEAKSLDEARIDHVIDFLCSAQINNPIVYQQAYQKIIDTWQTSSPKTRELTKYYYNQLCSQLKTAGLPLTQYHAIIKAVGDTPLPDGTRWWRVDKELSWRKALAAHWLIANSQESLLAEIAHYQKKKLPLMWANVLPALLYSDEKNSIAPTTRHLVKVTVAEKLIDSHGNWRATPGLPGRRPVIAYPNKYSPDFYMKPFPELPGIEYAIHALSQRWMGEATPNSQLMTLTFTDHKRNPLPQHPRAYPVLVSEAITQAVTLAGNHFENALLAEINPAETNSPSVQAKLDPFHFTQWFFLSLLIHPEDGTPHNFVVIQTPSGQYRLIGIDNDHHFVRPFLSGWLSDDSAFKDICTENKSPIPADPNAQQLLQVKTILYCLDQMQAPLDQQAIEAYLALDLPALIQTWLEDLAQWDQYHQSLLGKDQNYYLEGNCKNFGYIRPVFGSQTLTRLYQTSERLRRFLLDREQYPITHLQCLRQIHPLIGRRYLPLHEHSFKKRPPIARFKYLTDELKKIRSFRLPSSLSGRDILERMEGLSGEESLFEQIRNQRAYHPDEALKHLRKCFEEKKPLEQKKAEMKTGPVSPKKLAELFGKEILLPAHRAEILKAIPFGRIAKEDHSAIFQSLSGQDYEALDVSEVRGLNRWEWPRILLENINLQRLSIKNCSGIRDTLLVSLAERCLLLTDLTLNNVSIIRVELGSVFGFFPEPLYWPLLRRLDLKGCQRLESISLIAPKLESLYASDCPRLQSVSINSDVLRRLDLTGSAALNQLQLTGRASSWQSDWGTPAFEDKQSLSHFQQPWFLLGLVILFSSSTYALIDKLQANYWFEEYLKLPADSNLLSKLKEKTDKIKLLIAYSCVTLHKIFSLPLLIFGEDILPFLTPKIPKEHIDISSFEPFQFFSAAQEFKQNPFLYLAQEGCINELKLLYTTTISPYEIFWAAQDESGNTAMHLALIRNHDSVLEFACQQQAISIKIANFDGNTPFLLAASIGNVKFIQQLLEAFPEEKLWGQQNKNGETALHIAVTLSYDRIIELACQQQASSITLAKNDGSTPFLTAAYLGKVEFMRRLLEAFPTKNLWAQRNKNYDTALHLAVIHNHDDVVELACQQQASAITLVGNDGRTPFLKAASIYGISSMLRLLKAFPTQNLWAQQDSIGFTALHLAVKFKHRPIVELACNQHAISIKIGSLCTGNTPFLEAAYEGEVRFMKKLLNTYPEEKLWTQQNKCGKTALHLALDNNHNCVLELAYQQCAISIYMISDRNGNTSFLQAAALGKIQFMQKLFEAFPKENFWAQKNKNGDTALHLAMKNKRDSVLELACQQGVISLNSISSYWDLAPSLFPRISKYILKETASWLDWSLINRRISPTIEILPSCKESEQELNEIDLSLPEFLVATRHNQQTGWNSFEVAIDLSRDKLIKFALSPEEETFCRQLLTPEIRAAAVMTAILMNYNEKSTKKPSKILSEKLNPSDIDGFKSIALPYGIWDPEIYMIFNEYDDAQEQLNEVVRRLNDGSLGERWLTVTEFQQFFSIKRNCEIHQKAYKLFSESNQKILEKEQKLDEYCNRPAIYQKYIMESYGNDYYDEKPWSQCQSNMWQSSPYTSMIDIAARCKKKSIIIYEQENKQWNEIYRTEDQKGETLSIEYRPSQKDFVALKQNPNYITAIKSMLLTRFGLFQKPPARKSDDNHPVPKIICEYL